MNRENTTEKLDEMTLESKIPKVVAMALLFVATSMSAAFPVDRNGLSINVIYEKTEMPGYANFLIEAKNLTDQPRTLNGRIALYRIINGMEEPAGSCQVYLPVQPGESARNHSTCPARDFRIWKFYIDGIYEFILDQPQG